MRFVKSTGYIIKTTPVGEADRLVTIFTREQGKLTLMARGAKNLLSRRLGKLELFTLIRFEFIDRQGRNILTHVEVVEAYGDTKQELHDISRLFQIGELLNGLLPDLEPHEQVYDLVGKAFKNLAKFETPEYLRRFKVRLLAELGYGELADQSEEDLDSYIESLLERRLRTKHIF